jgi:hypothetical protein
MHSGAVLAGQPMVLSPDTAGVPAMRELLFARADLTVEQIADLRLGMQSEVMELVAGTRDTLERSRALLAQADVLLARDQLL